MTCKYCAEYFTHWQCGANRDTGECDCPKCQGYCECQTDPIVESVRQKLLDRSQVGIKKYGTTMERTDIDLLGWLEHLQMELMDAVIYLERAKQDCFTVEQAIEICKKVSDTPRAGYSGEYAQGVKNCIKALEFHA